jgi:hypothetical protein
MRNAKELPMRQATLFIQEDEFINITTPGIDMPRSGSVWPPGVGVLCRCLVLLPCAAAYGAFYDATCRCFRCFITSMHRVVSLVRVQLGNAGASAQRVAAVARVVAKVVAGSGCRRRMQRIVPRLAGRLGAVNTCRRRNPADIEGARFAICDIDGEWAHLACWR